MPFIPRHKRMFDTRATICAGVHQC
jgi:hypothetical protein